MKITSVRLRRVQGTMETEGAFWEERLARPIDIYPDYRSDPAREGGEQVSNTQFRITTYFLQIDTDDGPHGIAGPIKESVAYIVATMLRPVLLGRDPIAHECLWDQMHRLLVH